MQYRHFGKLNLKPSLLGFGAMRLPILNDDTDQIDTPEAIKMIRYAIDHGVNYIDTAWPYHGGNSEIVVGKALRDGYREKVMLATKSPTWLINKPEDWDSILEQQLAKLETDHIDFYLQHGMDSDDWKKFQEMNLWDRGMAAKAAGKFKYFGFSFHDRQELFKEIIEAYDWDFCQIQLNYLDTEFQAGLKGLEWAAAKNLGMVIMKPLRGKRLVTEMPVDIRAKFDQHPVRRNPVDWSLRWLANLPGVSVILSGMNNFEQVEENIRICSAPDIGVDSMTADELAFIEEVAKAWKSKILVGCTSCNYCMPCPHGVNIPGCFNTYDYSHSTIYGANEEAHKNYKFQFIDEKTDASQCVGCRACEAACPQQLAIVEKLRELHEELTK